MRKKAFAMDWKEERINNHTQIEYFEKDSLQKRKKSNKFTYLRAVRIVAISMAATITRRPSFCMLQVD